MLADLVDEQLPFAIGVARVHDALRVLQKRLDRLEQRRRGDVELPLLRHDGQMLKPPALILGRVGLGRCQRCWCGFFARRLQREGALRTDQESFAQLLLGKTSKIFLRKLFIFSQGV